MLVRYTLFVRQHVDVARNSADVPGPSRQRIGSRKRRAARILQQMMTVALSAFGRFSAWS